MMVPAGGASPAPTTARGLRARYRTNRVAKPPASRNFMEGGNVVGETNASTTPATTSMRDRPEHQAHASCTSLNQ